jgi:hypothetical protein
MPPRQGRQASHARQHCSRVPPVSQLQIQTVKRRRQRHCYTPAPPSGRTGPAGPSQFRKCEPLRPLSGGPELSAGVKGRRLARDAPGVLVPRWSKLLRAGGWAADTRPCDRRWVQGGAEGRVGERGDVSQLCRDGNPALLRYLRVIVPGAAEDVAAATWVQHEALHCLRRGVPTYLVGQAAG